MDMKSKTTVRGFGRTLSAARKSRGLTQADLSVRVGVSRRVIAYYEAESKYPPTHILIPIAKTLRISVDELLGLKKSEISDSEHTALWRKLKNAEALSIKDRKALINFLDALIIRTKATQQR